MSTGESSDGVEATFHEVVFGAPEGEQTRYSFDDFRGLSLRNRVRLLMSQPSQFFSLDGEPIERDQAMRFRQRTPKFEPSSPAVAPSPDKDLVSRLIVQLRDARESQALRAAIARSAGLDPQDHESREALATALLAAAKGLIHRDGPEAGEPALAQFARLVDTPRLAELAPLLSARHEAQTMSQVLKLLWLALSADQNYGLGLLAVRTRQLLVKFLDADWLCSPVNRALTADLLLAYSVLVPAANESELHQFFARARKLREGVIVELVRPTILDARTLATKSVSVTRERLALIDRLTSDAEI